VIDAVACMKQQGIDPTALPDTAPCAATWSR
jgi:hypothetical protein